MFKNESLSLVMAGDLMVISETLGSIHPHMALLGFERVCMSSFSAGQHELYNEILPKLHNVARAS